jgi:cytochrome bd-type quinol oxidase subunit 2
MSMKEKRTHKEARRTDIVFGISIITLAFVLGVLARTVITGEDFPFSGSDAQAEIGSMMP